MHSVRISWGRWALAPPVLPFVLLCQHSWHSAGVWRQGGVWDAANNSLLPLALILWVLLSRCWNGASGRSRSVGDCKQNQNAASLSSTDLSWTLWYLPVRLQFPVFHGGSVEGTVILMENDKFFLRLKYQAYPLTVKSNLLWLKCSPVR